MKPSAFRSSLFRNMFLLAGLSLSGALAFASFQEAGKPAAPGVKATSSHRTDLAHKPIDQIRVGERVVTELPDEAQEAGGVSPTSGAERNPEQSPADFRLIRMRGERVWKDGTIDDLNIETIQHVNWLEAHNVRIGALAPIPLDLVEMGEPADQQATVLAISPCPAISDGPGRIVLTTVNHLSPRIIRISILNHQGQIETLDTTPYHKFYDRSHCQWVSAEELQSGSILDGADLQVTVQHRVSIPATIRVYNLTVDGDHVYRVSGCAVLVHNTWCSFGNQPGGRGPRPNIDIPVDADGMVHPGTGGASLFNDPALAPLTGRHWELADDAPLPAGVAIVADGSDVLPGSALPPGHGTYAPTVPQSWADFVAGFFNLPWTRPN